jgi:hypothetical protein
MHFGGWEHANLFAKKNLEVVTDANENGAETLVRTLMSHYNNECRVKKNFKKCCCINWGLSLCTRKSNLIFGFFL